MTQILDEIAGSKLTKEQMESMKQIDPRKSQDFSSLSALLE